MLISILYLINCQIPEKKSEPLLDVYAVERTLFICHIIEEDMLEWEIVEKILGYQSKV